MDIQLDRPGVCRQCGIALKSVDEIEDSLTNTPDGLKVVRQFWHRACWQKRVADAYRNSVRSNPDSVPI